MNTESRTSHYVDNQKLLEVMKVYKKGVLAAKRKSGKKPGIPEYVGQCILLIATRLSLKPNFVNYSYREEMVSDGIENCISYIDNFDPKKSSNPFAYFTQIIYYAFLRRIQKEKKQLYIKHKSFENSTLMLTLLEQGELSDTEIANIPQQLDVDDGISTFIKNFETGIENKRKKRHEKTGKADPSIEQFIEEEVPAAPSDIYDSQKVGKIKKGKK